MRAAGSLDSDRIDMRLHEIERVHYAPRVEFLIALASGLDFEIGKAGRRTIIREARRLCPTGDVPRALATRAAGDINVRQQVIEILRRIGGAR